MFTAILYDRDVKVDTNINNSCTFLSSFAFAEGSECVCHITIYKKPGNLIGTDYFILGIWNCFMYDLIFKKNKPDSNK